MAGRTVQMLDYHWNINSCLIFFCRIVCLVLTVSSVLVFTTAFDTCVIQAVMSFAPTKRNRILFRNLSIFPRCRQAPVCSWLVIFARSKSRDVFGTNHQFQGIVFTFFPRSFRITLMQYMMVVIYQHAKVTGMQKFYFYFFKVTQETLYWLYLDIRRFQYRSNYVTTDKVKRK